MFISHAATDKPVAARLAAEIEAGGRRVKAFVASRPGHIRADSDWLPSVQEALKGADSFLILLSPNSVLRPWVYFEAGAASFSGKTCVFVTAGGLAPSEAPLPLSSKQLYSLEDPDEASAVFRALRLHLGSPDKSVQDIIAAVNSVHLAPILFI